MNVNLWLGIAVAIFVLAVYGVAIYAAWWALFSDRPRGRRRCPRCWQDLTHTPGMTCNECGFTAGRQADFDHTRRRWAVAAGAVATCVALAGWVYWITADRHWTSYAPTGVLLTALPFTQDPSGNVSRELGGRASRGQLDSDQWARLLRRCVRGDLWTRPVDEDWQEKYGNFILAGRARIDDDDELEWSEPVRLELLELPPAIELRTRSVWPIESEPHFLFQMRDWWPVGPDCRISVTPRLEGAEPEIFFRSGRRLPWSSLSFAVPGIDPGVEEVVFDVRVDRRIDASEPSEASALAANDDARWRTMSEESISVPVRFVEPAQAVLEPDSSLDLTQAVVATFNWGVVKYAQGGPGPVRFYFNRSPTNRTDFEGAGIGVRIELMKGDLIARRLDMWWLAGSMANQNPVASAVVVEDPALLDQVDDGPGWTVRITGDPELAMRAGDATRYWSGQFHLPLSLRVRDQEAPELRWWRQ